jgi:hypothetical protein
MAPQPKPPGARVRRNKDQSTWKQLDSAPRAIEPPPPEHWTDMRKAWWSAIWRSPMAAMWIESDVYNLLDLGETMELEKKSAEHLGEIRQMRAHYGLTPASRKSLMWNIPAEEDSAADDGEAPVSNVRKLRAV